MKTKSILLNLPIELYNDIYTNSKENNQSMTGYIINNLKEKINSNKKYNQVSSLELEIKKKIFAQYIDDEDIDSYTEQEILAVFDEENTSNDFYINLYKSKKNNVINIMK